MSGIGTYLRIGVLVHLWEYVYSVAWRSMCVRGRLCMNTRWRESE